MNFSDKQFEKIYLKLLMEQAEGVQFKYICKSCNTGFTDENGVAEGDACPVESCEDGKVEKFIADDIDPDNMPTAYTATEENDDAECDMQDDDLQDEFQDDDFADDEFQDEDADECDMQDDLQDEDFDDDEFQDEDADDEAAEEDEDENEDEEEADADEETVKVGSMIVSFTTEDSELIELIKKVQEGESKLVAVPLDFEFEEEDFQNAPVISAETVDNFDIEDVEKQEDQKEEAEQKETEQEDTESEQEDTDSEESTDELTKECNRYMNGCLKAAKPSKYGPY